MYTPTAWSGQQLGEGPQCSSEAYKETLKPYRKAIIKARDTKRYARLHWQQPEQVKSAPARGRMLQSALTIGGALLRDAYD